MAAPVQTRDQYLDLLSKPFEVPWPERFRAVQLMLNVEVSPRYTPDQRLEKGEVIIEPGTTWCNVYVTDFIKLMGVAAPTHWVMKDGAPAAVGKGTELRANGLLDWFEKYGAVTVFVTRLLPIVRTFISLPAGAARMPLGRFTLYTAAGAST